MTLEEGLRLFCNGYFATCRRSAKTRAAYHGDLNQFATWMGATTKIGAISPDHIEEWALELRRRGYSPRSLRRKFASLRVFFNYCCRRRRLERSPFWQLRLDLGKPAPLTRILTATELGCMLTVAARSARASSHSGVAHARALRNYALVCLMSETGIRVGEAAALDEPDVLPAEQAILVHGKGERQRLAFFVDGTTSDAMDRYLHARKRMARGGCAALFVNARGTRLSTQGIADVICKLAYKAGVCQHVTPHMVRHTAATMLLRAGADIRVVQDFLGHASIATTQQYTHITKEHLLETLRQARPRIVAELKMH